jgi:hypothetical protein
LHSTRLSSSFDIPPQPSQKRASPMNANEKFIAADAHVDAAAIAPLPNSKKT